MTTEHLDLMVELNSDPEVMRYLLGRAATRAEVEAEWSSRLGPRSDDSRGLGYWAGFHDGRFVGWWGLAVDGENGSANLGYRLCREAWGQGLATEGARSVVDHGFWTLGLDRVWASTMAVNTGSRRVLSKLGLTHTQTLVMEWEDPLPGSELGEVVYELRRPDLNVD